MHISLDAALQRQPLLSTVGDKLLPTFPGAAAAYSLRALNGDANNVARVRRDGDDAELDFTAEGVSFELEDWVNGKLEDTLPADVATAAAAYSLRKVRDAYTGNALQVRRVFDNIEVDVGFDANGEVSNDSPIYDVTEESDTNTGQPFNKRTETLGEFISSFDYTRLPADQADAAAAYSLRKVKEDYTGNALKIRRPSDDVEVNVAFDANGEVSASSAISNVEDIELVSESGFATDTGGFASSISGANFTFGNTLDGKDDVLFATFDGSGLLGLNFSTSDVAIGDVVTYSFDVYWASTNTGGLPDLRIRSGNTTIGHSDVPMPSEDSWYTFSGQFTVTSNTPTALTLIAADSSGLTTGDVFAIANGSYGKQQDAGDTTATTLGGFLTEGVTTFNPDFSSSANGFISFSGDTISFNQDGIGGLDDNLSSTAQDSSSQVFGLNGRITTGVQYNISLRYFIPESNGGSTTEVSIRDGASIKIATDSSPTAGSWVTIEGTATFTTPQIRVQFTATSVAGDNVYLRDFVITRKTHDATVVTWYDQSGNNDATQTDKNSQPKIAEAGSLLTNGNGDTVIDCVDTDFFNVSGISLSGGLSIVSVLDYDSSDLVQSLYGTDGASISPRLRLSTATDFTTDTNSGSLGNIVNEGSQVCIASFYRNASDSVQMYLNSSTLGSPATVAGDITITRILARNDGATDGLNSGISELIFYNSDQSDNRPAIEKNIGDHYGISTPAVSQDVTVVTWYDQSVNGYDATQDTAGDQPKIAEAGSLLTLAGKPTIKANGTTHFLQNLDSAWDGIMSSDFSVFVAGSKTSDVNAELISCGDASSENSGFDWLVGAGGNTSTLNYRGAELNVSFLGVTSSGATLFSAIDSDPSTNGNAYLNGAESGETPVAQNRSGTADRLTLFARRDGNSFYDGEISEVVIYPASQHDNRFKIESNINNHYGIYTPAEDGFVETWYDQSGNGNHAVQASTGLQPKIVANGSYLGELDFDGDDDCLETDNGDLCNLSELSLFTVLKPFTGASQERAISAGSTVSGSTAYGGWVLNFNGYVDQAQLQTQSLGSSAITSASQSVTTSESVITAILNVPNGTTSVNGTEGTTSTDMIEPFNNNDGRRKLRIGCHFTFNRSNHYSKPIKEVILYTSDQSANRPAIESNIADEYGITLS
jgi:hypothetical protein